MVPGFCHREEIHIMLSGHLKKKCEFILNWVFGDGGERQENYEHNCLDNRILAMYKFVQKPW